MNYHWVNIAILLIVTTILADQITGRQRILEALKGVEQ
jgi:hypothetical protein